MSVFLIWISQWMGQQFDELHARGDKVGERTKLLSMQQAQAQNDADDTSCLEPSGPAAPAADKRLGAEDEGQSWKETEEALAKAKTEV